MVNENRKIWAVVFDLDETLVLTSTIEPLRRKRVWSEVYAAFEKTRLPNGTPEFLQKVIQIARVGVVTKAPRAYAEKLLAYHNLNIPVLAAFHDVTKRKPDPEGLLLASQKLAIEAPRCIYVGDDADDVLAARCAGYTPIGICWDVPRQIGLHSICQSWDTVHKEIVRIIKG
jgi:HAD superfamily hydrolase (TIGR01549 family)